MNAMPAAVFCGICAAEADQSRTTVETPARLDPAAGVESIVIRGAQGRSSARDWRVEADETKTCSMPSAPSEACGPEALARKLVAETLISCTPLTVTIRSE